MITQIQRDASDVITITIGASAGASEEINFRQYAGARFIVPTGSALTSLTWYESHDGTTWVPAHDADGVAIVQTVAQTKGFTLPEELFACQRLKAVGNDVGSIFFMPKS